MGGRSLLSILLRDCRTDQHTSSTSPTPPKKQQVLASSLPDCHASQRASFAAALYHEARGEDLKALHLLVSVAGQAADGGLTGGVWCASVLVWYGMIASYPSVRPPAPLRAPPPHTHTNTHTHTPSGDVYMRELARCHLRCLRRRVAAQAVPRWRSPTTGFETPRVIRGIYEMNGCRVCNGG